ncbi:MAG: succinate dehydrogenase, cytochrome b556 subunit [Chloroflexi bacterium]|nr:MAG: succinate dehydrogenase, cytochrome b556 subunit [Chloroflexota bacterium]
MNQPSPQTQFITLLHRIAGAGMFLFLALHIAHIALMSQGPEPFNTLAQLFNRPAGRLLHLFLFFGVLFHAVNGTRIILLDFVPALQRYRRASVYAAWFLFAALFIPSALLLLMDAFLPPL